MSYFTGVYRMLGVQNFAKEKLIGFAFDIVFTLALFIIQWLNKNELGNGSKSLSIPN